MPTAPPDPKRLARAAELVAAGVSYSEVSRQTGIDRGTVRKYIPRAGRGSAAPESTPEERKARQRELAAEREQLEAVAGEKAFRSFLANLFRENVKPLPPVKPTPLRPKRSAAKRLPLLHLSDWHFEEVVKAEAVLGLNSYDIPTACRRVYRVVQSFRGWHRDQTAGGRYAMPELVVALNGDMLAGVLHGLERHSSAANVIRATLACGRLLALALRDLACDFPRVRVVGTVGNHGRLPDDKKVPTKDPTRSFDYLAYGVAREILRDARHVEWTLPEGYGAVYEVAGHTCYQGHGNFVKQQLGIVGYGMRRFVSNLAANMGAAGRSLRYAFFGHFHQASAAEFAGVTAFICPSIIGTQEYSFLSGGSVNRPCQQAFVFDPDLGHVETLNFFGEGPGYDGTYPVEV